MFIFKWNCFLFDFCVPGEDGAGGELDVADFEAGEGDEDEDLDAEGFGEEEVGDDDEREGEEEDEAPEETAGFNGDEHEVRERAPGDEERAVEVGSDRLVRRRFARVARRNGREAPPLLLRRHRLGNWSLSFFSLFLCVRFLSEGWCEIEGGGFKWGSWGWNYRAVPASWVYKLIN